MLLGCEGFGLRCAFGYLVLVGLLDCVVICRLFMFADNDFNAYGELTLCMLLV